MKRVLSRAAKTEEYVCDLLFKKVDAGNVHRVFDTGLCVSKEAVDRLPEAFRDDDTLERLCVACGSPDKGFTPEMLKTGIWLLSGLFLYCSSDVDEALFANRLHFLDTVAEALEYIRDRYEESDLSEFKVYENGVLVRTWKPEVRLQAV